MWTTKEKPKATEIELESSFYKAKIKVRAEKVLCHEHLIVNINGKDFVELHIDPLFLGIHDARTNEEVRRNNPPFPIINNWTES